MRIAARHLDDPDLDAATLATDVEHFSETPSTGGGAIDAVGNIDVGDIDRRTVLRFMPDGACTTLVRDPRRVWVDAF